MRYRHPPALLQSRYAALQIRPLPILLRFHEISEFITSDESVLRHTKRKQNLMAMSNQHERQARSRIHVSVRLPKAPTSTHRALHACRGYRRIEAILANPDAAGA